MPREPHPRVTADPFWSTVRRRHPDLDIVLLPGPGPERAAVPAETVPCDAEAVGEELDAAADERWATLAPTGPVDPDAAQPVRRWAGGVAPGTLRREVTWRVEADVAAGAAALLAAERLLTAEGWHCFVAPQGLPRVTASRVADLGREEVTLAQVLLADPPGLVVRWRSGSVPVADCAALLAGQVRA